MNFTKKEIQLFFFIFFFSFLSIQAQTTKRNFLQKLPEQDLSASLIPQKLWKPFPKTPEEWKAKFPDSLLKKFILAGEQALEKEFKSIPATVALQFIRTGNRSNYQAFANEKRVLLWDLALAESIEGKGRFADHLLDGIWSICEETFWGATAHLGNQKAGKGLPDVEDPIVDLFAAETASTLAWVDYFTAPILEKTSPLLRRRIAYEVERRIFIPMQTANYFYLGRGNPDAILNNWTPWIMSNYIATVLLLEADETKRAAGLKFAMRYIDQYINGLGEDGGCDEGPGYWFGAAGTVFDALSLLDNATAGKTNIYHEPFIQKMASYIYKTHIDGEYFINVADASPKMRPNGVALYRFGKAINDPKMMAFGSWAFRKFAGNSYSISQYHRSRTLFDLNNIEECKNYNIKYKNDSDTWFSDVQLMATRSKESFLASHAGHNGESHNHNDVGDFMVYINGYPVIIDVGSGNYTARTFSPYRYKLWFNTSAFHNLPTINGYQQGAGSSFSASKVKYSSNNTSSSLSMDIAPSYPKESGITSWKRNVSLNKSGTISIIDQYRSEKPFDSLIQSFMTVCDTNTDTLGKIKFSLPDGSYVFMTYDPSLWSISKEKVKLVDEEDQKFKSAWGGKDIYRILLTSKKSNSKGTFQYQIFK
ncbi:Heparinase II/III family protein [Pseudopedobacter saltans DSM 12145]|uniref:Heparinase II/III family protein n=1 Tax=Pseudopedobacter saltans (strain ATCC 51119 / DSM 12145 / JCM 21818 / CCUG 39354 / LMG 10337 / NBRC 100064 / NCIMB 13643) TaxID=762903 RepID=F0SCQ4_PSESL|nr:heparinase II/III family protein [Pseudopedobacter saltans]ADY53898.1 Heparinase II/III family protein [Pseudopedobacter saltans DSM 12145]